MSQYQGYDDPRADQGEPLEPVNPDQPIGDGQPAGEGIGPQQTQAPTEPPSFDPTGFALNYRGQQVYPKDREHLINLAQQGYSYSQNMEKLNQQQKEIEEIKAKYSTYENLDNVLTQNPALAQEIQRVYQNHVGGGAPAQGNEDEYQDDPRYQQLLQANQQTREELAELKKWREESLNSQADRELNESIEALKKQYPDQPWDQDNGQGTLHQRIINHALEKDITDLNLAYKDYMWDHVQANTTADALRKSKEQRQKDFNNGIVDTGGNQGPGSRAPDLQYNKGDDYGDLTRKAIHLLGG